MKEYKTNICCLNTPQSIVEYLQQEHGVYDGCIGKRIDLSPLKRQEYFLLPMVDFPENFQEYDVFILDLKIPNLIPYNIRQHERQHVGDGENLYFLTKSTQTVFDSIPFGAYQFNCKLRKNIHKTPPIIVVFQEKQYECNYAIVNRFSEYNYNDERNSELSNYDFTKSLRLHNSEIGEQFAIENNKWSKRLFLGIEDKLIYKQTFLPRMILNQQTNEYEYDTHVVPLLRNRNGEVVSFAQAFEEEPIFFVLPQADDDTKLEIIKRLFEGILYENFSSYFPTIEKSKWIHKVLYAHPEVRKIDDEIISLEKDYLARKEQLEHQKEGISHSYDFLQKLITATGDDLVQAMIVYLKWLGFENVIDKDTTAEAVLEEDIQVDLGGNRLLIIEIKGIYRTSQDSECSQIDKIRYRRLKQDRNREIYALYIVNHQRGIEPVARQNPPFTKEQMEDAVSCDRGMMTTWQLFKIYQAVELGAISKVHVRNSLIQTGVIVFEPDLVKPINDPYHQWQEGMVLGIDVNTPIGVGDDIFVENGNGWYCAKVTSIQQEGISYECVEKGKTGIGLSQKLPNGKFYVKRHV